MLTLQNCCLIGKRTVVRRSLQELTLSLPRRPVKCFADVSLELQQLRHCLAVVARCAAVELAVAMPTLFTPGLRRLLWAALSAWSQDASPEAKPGTYRADVRTRPPF